MGLTKFVLKRPVTTILAVLCLIVFGLSSVLSSKLELIPEMEMPMMVVFTTYAGASPEDVSELVTKPIEDEIGTLSGVKSVTSYSQENISMVLLEYQYGTDMDKAYNDLKKKTDLLPLLQEKDQNILRTSIELKEKNSLSFEEILQFSDLLLNWSSKWIREVR